MKLLVSVRSEREARLAAAGGADFIDLKEPRDGALGGLPIDTISAIVRTLRADGTPLPIMRISATIGDLGMGEIRRIAAAVRAVAACGVDYVKVGIEAAPGAAEVLAMLARCEAALVPVFIADRGIDAALLRQACATAAFPAVMADTADKRAGSLFDACPETDLRRFVAEVRLSGKLVGLAGALRRADLPRLHALAPDFAGFRSAVCEGDRAGALSAERLRALAGAVHASRPVAVPLS